MLHEPGDAAAMAVFEARGVQAIEDYQSGKALNIWPELVPSEYIGEVPALIERIGLRLPHIDPVATIERAIRWNARPVFACDAPKLFALLDDLGLHRPYLLWVAGDLDFLDGSQVAIVGTRWPSDSGLENTRRLVRELGVSVVSGGAKGIDAQAHRAAIAHGLPTAAFMAGGLDRAYPQENWNLFHDIVRGGGAMISELAPRSAPTRFRFLQRNRLIAASGTATFVVEAGYRSGSKNTAGHSRLLGRDTYALVGGGKGAQRGCEAMVASGLAMPFRLSAGSDDSLGQRIEDAKRNGSRTVEEIARESGVSIAQVRQGLAAGN